MDTKKFITECYKLYAAGDLKGLLAHFSNEADLNSPESDYLPIGGNYHGQQQIADYFVKMNEMVQCTYLEPKTLVQEGDTVVVTGESSWIARSTGISYDNPFVHVFKVRDEKIESVRSYWDTSKLEHALHPASAASQAAGKPLHH